jgi:hypothetical protein
MLIAYIDYVAAGFVSGVEMSHPDKGTEMFLYELSVAEENEGAESDGRWSRRWANSQSSEVAMAFGSALNPTKSRPSPRTKLPEPNSQNRSSP